MHVLYNPRHSSTLRCNVLYFTHFLRAGISIHSSLMICLQGLYMNSRIAKYYKGYGIFGLLY